MLVGGLGPGFFPETRVVGTVIVWSDKPLLHWAWAVEHHMERLTGTGRNYHDQVPQSIGQMHVPIIPVDSSADKGKAPRTFRWVCDAVLGPPPPQ